MVPGSHRETAEMLSYVKDQTWGMLAVLVITLVLPLILVITSCWIYIKFVKARRTGLPGEPIQRCYYNWRLGRHEPSFGRKVAGVEGEVRPVQITLDQLE